MYAPQITSFAQSIINSPIAQLGFIQAVDDAKQGNYPMAIFGAAISGEVPAGKTMSAVGKTESMGKLADGLRLGQNIPSLGKVIENASGKINGFNHNGTYHGLDQIISRGVSPQTIADTIKNPLARFAGRFERVGCLSKEAYVVMDKTGQVVTSWTKNEFGSTIKNVLNRITK